MKTKSVQLTEIVQRTEQVCAVRINEILRISDNEYESLKTYFVQMSENKETCLDRRTADYQTRQILNRLDRKGMTNLAYALQQSLWLLTKDVKKSRSVPEKTMDIDELPLVVAAQLGWMALEKYVAIKERDCLGIYTVMKNLLLLFGENDVVMQYQKYLDEHAALACMKEGKGPRSFVQEPSFRDRDLAYAAGLAKARDIYQSAMSSKYSVKTIDKLNALVVLSDVYPKCTDIRSYIDDLCVKIIIPEFSKIEKATDFSQALFRISSIRSPDFYLLLGIETVKVNYDNINNQKSDTEKKIILRSMPLKMVAIINMLNYLRHSCKFDYVKRVILYSAAIDYPHEILDTLLRAYDSIVGEKYVQQVFARQIKKFP